MERRHEENLTRKGKQRRKTENLGCFRDQVLIAAMGARDCSFGAPLKIQRSGAHSRQDIVPAGQNKTEAVPPSFQQNSQKRQVKFMNEILVKRHGLVNLKNVPNLRITAYFD